MMERKRNTTELRLLTEELFADISTRCLLAAKAAKGMGKDGVADTADVLDDGNREVVRNIMSRLVAECVAMLHPFAKRHARRVPIDDRVDEVDEYVVELSFPMERGETEMLHLLRCAHDYVVYKCLAEWLALTLPDTGQWQAWEQKAQDVREELAAALARPLRPGALHIRPRFY